MGRKEVESRKSKVESRKVEGQDAELGLGGPGEWDVMTAGEG